MILNFFAEERRKNQKPGDETKDKEGSKADPGHAGAVSAGPAHGHGALALGSFAKAWAQLVEERVVTANFGGCLHVCCDVPSIEPSYEFLSSDLPACANISAAFGLHPVCVCVCVCVLTWVCLQHNAKEY